MNRLRSMIWVLIALLLASCGSQGTEEPAPETASTVSTETASATGTSPAPSGAGEDRSAANQAHQQALRRYRVHLDLLSVAHLADIDHDGLFIDVGTPARWKYTHGNWKNHCGATGTDADRSYGRFGEKAFFWFHVDDPSDTSLRLSLRRVGTPNLVAYLNGHTLRTLDLRDGWQTLEVPISKTQLRRGENKLQLRATETEMVGGQAVSVELDWLHFRRRAEAAAPEAASAPESQPPYEFLPSLERSQGTVRIGAGERGLRRAWSLDPGSRVRFHVQVPERAKLSFGLGTAGDRSRASVRVWTALEAPTELWSGPVPKEYTDQLISLEEYAGKVIALEFVTEGNERAEIGLSRPQILVPLPSMPRSPGHAKHVVVLTIDTLRASKLQPYNRRSRVRTPRFNQFVQEATLFEQAQSPENWTKPSVASILTSLTPMTHGTKKDGASLPESALTLGEVYQQAGFKTATFLANGYVSDRFGFDQGWHHYTNYIRENRSTEAETVFREAYRWIREHQEERLFVYIQTIDPHVPYDPPDEFLRLYDPDPEAYDGQVSNRRTARLLGSAKQGKLTFTDADKRRLEALHDAEISYHDRHFGRFIDQLEELGMLDDTIFVVTSDHGEEFEEHGSWGHGHSVYQELLHVPLVVRFPLADAAQKRILQTVSTMDIGPTVLEASGVEIPEVFEGQSLLGYLRDQPPAGPAVAFSDFLDDRRVIRAGRHKLILRGNHTSVLFDLQRDPGERRELNARSSNSVGLRFVRTHLGQFLGAPDRGNWLYGTNPESSDSVPPPILPSVDAEMDEELCEQLQQLGYGCST